MQKNYRLNPLVGLTTEKLLPTALYSARLVNIYKPITPHNYIVCFVHPFVWYVCVLHKTIVIAIYKFQDEGKYTDRKSEEVETAAMIW